MTDEDQNQIRQIVAESEARTIEAFTRRMDRAAESFAIDLTQVREETRTHLEGIDRRLDRISEAVRSIGLRISVMNK